MEGDPQDRPRFISVEEGQQLFAMQMQVLPALQAEVIRLSAGKIGVIGAIINRMGDAVSLDPDVETTPALIRRTVGAPEDDDADLEPWRESFWKQHKPE